MTVELGSVFVGWELLLLLSCGQETGVSGTASAAWTDDSMGHGRLCFPGEEGEGERVEVSPPPIPPSYPPTFFRPVRTLLFVGLRKKPILSFVHITTSLTPSSENR